MGAFTQPIVHSVQLDQNQLTLSGAAEPPKKDGDLALVIKKRKTSETYTFPLNWHGNKEWQATIQLADIPMSTGTWDYYVSYHATEKYRLKVDEALKIAEEQTAFVNQKQHTYHVQCYITKKGSFSFKTSTPSIAITHMTGQLLDDNTVRLTGNIRENKYLSADSLTEAALVIKRERAAEAWQTLPLNRLSEEQPTAFYADLNYQTIANDTETDKWDLYIRIGQPDRHYLFRIKLEESAENLEQQTCTEWDGDTFSLIYVYSTVYHHLSIKRTEPRIKQDITSYAISDGKLYVQGYAYLDLIPFDRADKLNRLFVIRKRDSDQALTIPIENIILPDTKNGDHPYAGFSVALSLKDIQGMQADLVDLYDMAIRLEYGSYVREKRLGFHTYDFYEDDPLDDVTFRYGTKGVRCYLLLTPGGYLTLETYTYANWKLPLLKTMQKQPPSARDIWLIGERPDTAQDTGYHFFKYCRQQFPDLAIYYVIKKDSPDFERVRPLGHVVPFGSLRHFQMAAAANTFIGSHGLQNLLPTRAIDWPSYRYGTRVFIQHGVLGRKKVDYVKHQYQYPFSVFCVSSEPERQMVIDKMGYLPEEVYVTGLSRFDRLMAEPRTKRRSILLIPTWRAWLKHDDTFLTSAYFQHYYQLLADTRLHTILEEQDVEIDFYLHYRMQPYIAYFRELASDRINIIAFNEADVQSLLLSNQLLITDYSSVSFDFNYMAKPVLFYHFDFNRFFRQGLLRPAEETFLGEVCYDQETLIQAIHKHIANGFQESPDVSERKGSIFDHIDQSNNQRIMNAIKNAKEDKA